MKELINVHSRDRCEGQACVIHNPSDHKMRDWPLNWRGDRGLMERICPHGIGHPDPDDLAYQDPDGSKAIGVHGCDGCCAVVKCERCDGEGYIWDDTACGDPDHCSPNYDCSDCKGTGKVRA